MKKINSIVTFPLLLISLISCTDDVSNLDSAIKDTNNENSKLSETEAAIQNCIVRKHGLSRSETMTMLPYILEGDTVMYIVNYSTGWEIYANDIHMPMIVMQSEVGNFYPTEITFEESPLLEVLNRAANTIREVKRNELDVKDAPDSTWTPYLPKATYATSGERHLVAQGWEDNEYIYTPKSGRLITKWCQDKGFKQFTRQLYNSSGELQNALVGCGPVAVGQYLYWYHKHFGTPKSFPARAELYGNQYKFYGESTDWDAIFTDNSDYVITEYEKMKPTALFLGNIADNMKVSFGLESTGSDKHNILNEIIRQTSVDHTYDYCTSDKVIKWLSQGYPLVAFGDIIKNNEPDGHAYIIDYCRVETYSSLCYWAYVDKPVGDDEDEDPLAEYDNPTLEQVKEVYGDDVQVTKSTTSRLWVMINWGWRNTTLDTAELYYNYLVNSYSQVENIKVANPTIVYPEF